MILGTGTANIAYVVLLLSQALITDRLTQNLSFSINWQFAQTCQTTAYELSQSMQLSHSMVVNFHFESGRKSGNQWVSDKSVIHSRHTHYQVQIQQCPTEATERLVSLSSPSQGCWRTPDVPSPDSTCAACTEQNYHNIVEPLSPSQHSLGALKWWLY